MLNVLTPILQVKSLWTLTFCELQSFCSRFRHSQGRVWGRRFGVRRRGRKKTERWEGSTWLEASDRNSLLPNTSIFWTDITAARERERTRERMEKEGGGVTPIIHRNSLTLYPENFSWGGSAGEEKGKGKGRNKKAREDGRNVWREACGGGETRVINRDKENTEVKEFRCWDRERARDSRMTEQISGEDTKRGKKGTKAGFTPSSLLRLLLVTLYESPNKLSAEFYNRPCDRVWRSSRGKPAIKQKWLRSPYVIHQSLIRTNIL